MTTFAYRFDALVDAMRRATARGRKRFLAGHRRLVRQGAHLPAVPDGMRVIAGRLVPVTTEPECAFPRRRQL